MVTILALMGAARAHVGDIVAAVDILESGAERPLSIEATFGLVIGQEDGTYAWVCHEAVTANSSIFLPDYDLSTDGEWLSNVRIVEEGRGGRTLFHSPDGCAWNDVVGLDEVVINQARFDPEDPTRAFAVGAAGGTYSSSDGGRNWDVDLEPTTDRSFQELAVVDGEVYATGTNDAGTEAFVWHRDAAGSWTSFTLPDLGGLEGARLRILTVSDDALYLNADPIGSDVLFVADRELTTFVRTIMDQGEILDAAVTSGGVWLPMDFGQRALRLLDDGTYTEVQIPPGTGVGLDNDGRLLLAAAAYIDGPLVSVLEDDDTFTPLVYPDDVTAPLDCPAGTEAAEICTPLWVGLEPRLRGFDEPIEDSGDVIPPPPPTDDEGCGCTTTEPAGLGVLVLPALLWLRRRRATRRG